MSNIIAHVLGQGSHSGFTNEIRGQLIELTGRGFPHLIQIIKYFSQAKVYIPRTHATDWRRNSTFGQYDTGHSNEIQ